MVLCEPKGFIPRLGRLRSRRDHSTRQCAMGTAPTADRGLIEREGATSITGDKAGPTRSDHRAVAGPGYGAMALLPATRRRDIPLRYGCAALRRLSSGRPGRVRRFDTGATWAQRLPRLLRALDRPQTQRSDYPTLSPTGRAGPKPWPRFTDFSARERPRPDRLLSALKRCRGALSAPRRAPTANEAVLYGWLANRKVRNEHA